MTYQVDVDFVTSGFSGRATFEEDSAGYPGDPAEDVIIVEIALEHEDGETIINKHSKPFERAVFHGVCALLYGSKFEAEACEDLHDIYAEDLY